MKNTDLIAHVGGIEKAREIVVGAPEWARAYNTHRKYYTGASWFYGEFYLDDLCTAIAEHDRAVGEPEFKVGDLVVKSGSIHFKSKSFSLWIVNHVMQTTIPCLDVTPLSKKGKPVHASNQVAVNQQFRHATPAEIKAGHRIDGALTNEGAKVSVLGDSDDVADISYHVSPSTVVINESN